MQRDLLRSLINWKHQPARKPLLIDGARQTGKTYLLSELLGQTFPRVIRIDFLERPDFKRAFSGSLSPEVVLANIELLTDQSFDPSSDLLILDEIGECQQAVTALKYFAEQMPHAFVAASGSNIGLLNSFPVGKVEQYNLRPLTFYEFLRASGESALISAFESRVNSEVVHTRLMDRLTDYLFTGGMPEAVVAWFDTQNASMRDRAKRVSQIHQDLLAGYRRDFGKYAGKVSAMLIEAVFNAIPEQLARLHDQSVKRFQFKDVYPSKSRYRDFETAIDWLRSCRLALANFPIEGRPTQPLAAYTKANQLKLFLFDVGLLNHMLGSTYHEIKNQNYAYKGYVAENFVQQELVAQGIDPTFSWHDARAEIEFIVSSMRGDIVPIEVKSGSRTRARSLASFVAKCAPKQTLKLTGTRGSLESEQVHRVLPLYYAHFLFTVLAD